MRTFWFELKELFLDSLPVVLMFIIIAGLIIGSVMWGASTTCFATANKMNFESDYGLITGCMINVDGQWIPIGNYRVVE